MVPLMIRVHMGITLLVSGVTRQLFVPNLELPVNLLRGVIGLAEIAIGLSFVYGALARSAAAALGALWIVGAVLFGPTRLIEHAEVLGVAFFLFVTGRGPLAFDKAMERLHRPIPALIPYVVPVLRISTALAIIVVAFTEKLWNIPMGLAFLAEHHFNFFPTIYGIFALLLLWGDEQPPEQGTLTSALSGHPRAA